MLIPSFSTPLHWIRGDGASVLDVARLVSVLVAVLDVAVDVVIVTVVAEVAVVVVAEIVVSAAVVDVDVDDMTVEVDAGASPQLIARWAFNAEPVTP